MHITEQASKNKGSWINVKFSTGQSCNILKNGDRLYYSKAGHMMTKAKNGNMIAKMDELIAKGF